MNNLPETITRNRYEVTVCCDVMRDLVRGGRGEPVEYQWEGEDEVRACLDLMGDEDICVATAYYCPNCGTKVQLRRLPDG